MKKMCDEKRRMLQDLLKNSIVGVYLCASRKCVSGVYGRKH